MFLQDGQRLAARQIRSDEVVVFDLLTGGIKTRWSPLPGEPARAIGRFGDRLVLSLPIRRIHVIDGLTGAVTADFLVDDGRLGVFQVALSSDTKYLVAGSEYGLVSLWNVSDGSRIDVLKGHLRGVHSVAFLPDGQRFLSFSGDAEALKLWDIATRQEVATLPGDGSLLTSPRISADGSVIAVASSKGLHVWRAPSWEKIAAAEARHKSEAQTE
jgi:WD40 repeat protein